MNEEYWTNEVERIKLNELSVAIKKGADHIKDFRLYAICAFHLQECGDFIF